MLILELPVTVSPIPGHQVIPQENSVQSAIFKQQGSN